MDNSRRTKSPAGRLALAAGALASTMLAADMAAAQTSGRWQADEAEALAVLPPPGAGTGVEAATLGCAAQRWSLSLTLAELGGGKSRTAATLRVDGRSFDTSAALDGKTFAIAVPRTAIDPLKAGLRMALAIDGVVGGMLGEVAFPLRGSKVAIEAAERRCTPREMTGYTPVTFTPFSSYMNLVRELRATDIERFATATFSQPDVSAAMSEFGENRRVLFTRLCGSSWYFGASGCNVTGFAPEGDGWRIVYDTENVHLYLDPRSDRQGWPDLATLPVRADGAGRLWRWDGKSYALEGDLPEPDDAGNLQLRAGHD